MKFCLSLLFFSASTLTYSQSNKGNIHFDINGGLNIFSQESNFSADESIGAATKVIGVNGSYFIQPGLSLGLKFNHHVFFTEEDNDSTTNVTDARASTLMFTTAYHIIDRAKFIWYGSVAMGVSQLKISLEHPPSESEGYAELNGLSYGIETGIKKYFNNWIGMNFSVGFNNHRLQFSYIEVEGNEIEYLRLRKVDASRVNYFGPEMKLGLSFRIN